jgi:hypothetical protein
MPREKEHPMRGLTAFAALMIAAVVASLGARADAQPDRLRFAPARLAGVPRAKAEGRAYREPGVPVRATFTADKAEHTWALADLDPQLPADWTPYEFLVLEFKASSSQRFDLGIDTGQGRIAKRIGPFAGVWVRASIPLRYYREPAGSAGDLAATYNQPRNSYWINIHSNIVGPTTGVRALAVTMPNPVGAPTLDIRSIVLAKTDPGDAVLDGTPLIDEFGQYVHAVWPGKARSLDDLKKAWAVEDEALKDRFDDRCAYGGFASTHAKATGYFRVERIDGRWWFVDPDGHLFISTGANGVGTAFGTRVQGREDLFAALPPAQLGSAGGGATFYVWNLQRRYGDDWRPKWAEAATRRLAAWGFNSVHYWGPRGQVAGAEPRVPYAQMLRWQLGRSTMGMPDVYAEDFARRVDEAAATQLDSRSQDPWMLGYFIGNEPSWPGREGQLVDLLLAGPAGEMQKRLKAHLDGGDTPERRKAFVLASFGRYLEVINGAVRKHAPDHLNLGIRFGGDPHEEVLRAARGFDVFSINIYRYAPPRATLDRVFELTRLPMLIGEFHIGAPERGLAPGLVQAMNQEERGVAYRYYVEQSIAHPAMIGTHWFQWLDQPATGRNDGENYNIGFIDVTDQPYAELVAAAKVTHARLLAVHGGKVPPFDRMPRAR